MHTLGEGILGYGYGTVIKTHVRGEVFLFRGDSGGNEEKMESTCAGVCVNEDL